MADYDDWPHPDRCPSSDCRGQFFWIRHYGMICSVRFAQLTKGRDPLAVAQELSKQAEQTQIESTDGLGGA